MGSQKFCLIVTACRVCFGHYSLNNSITMKVTLVFVAAFCTLALGQHNLNLHTLIRNEVHALYQADNNLTVDNCTTECDALFDLIAGHDEQTTDMMCKQECTCQKNHSCTHHNNNHHNQNTNTNTNAP